MNIPCKFHRDCSCFMAAWHSGRMQVFDRQTFPVPRSTCSWWVTTYVGKPSIIGQPTRPTQPFILVGLINSVVANFIRCVLVILWVFTRLKLVRLWIAVRRVWLQYGRLNISVCVLVPSCIAADCTLRRQLNKGTLKNKIKFMRYLGNKIFPVEWTWQTDSLITQCPRWHCRETKT